MTIWHVMRTYNETGVYYQVLPYDARVICDLLRLKNGLRQAINFLRNSRWTKKKAYRLAKRKNLSAFI